MTIIRIACAAIALSWLGGTISPPADAQRSDYRDRYDSRDRDSRQRNVPGRFDYYALVLSWSPTHCANAQRGRDDLQCNRRDGRRYNFVLHGLWPQYERGFPDSCPTRDRPFVPNRIIDQMLDIMPAKGLIIHEYKKHGTCSGLSPDAYFALARRAYGRVRRPEVLRRLQRPVRLPASVIEEAFLQANPGWSRDMLTITCKEGRIAEARLCLSRGLEPLPCGSDMVRDCPLKDAVFAPVR